MSVCSSMPASTVFIWNELFENISVPAQASCTRAIRTAQAVVKDLGEEKAGEIGGLLRLSKCSTKNPERDAHSVLSKRLGLALDIPIRTISVTSEECEDSDTTHLEIQRLSLVDWASLLLKTNTWHILAGLLKPDAKRERCIWTAFWKAYETLEPAHPVFAMARSNQIDLSRTAAVVLHGDEGRGRRRQAFMVLSFHSLLGRGTNSANRKSVKKPYLKMKLNYKGHTYCSRMLAGVLPKRLYQDNDEVFQALLRATCEDARTMISDGVLSNTGDRHWIACLSTVGDWPFLQKAGGLTRTFNNVVKRVDQVASGICHWCDCGPDSLPFERFSTRRPDWMGTLFTTSPFLQSPASSVIPHAPGKLASTFQFDLFHNWHLGVGRNFSGSALVLLSDLHDGNVEERFAQVTIQYKDWCKRTGHSPIMSKIHKDNIQRGSTSEFPTGTWFKGGVTTNMVLFFEDCKDFCISRKPDSVRFAAETSHDFVGRQSRLSRRVAPQQAIKRVIERYLQAAYSEFVASGYFVLPAS
ncbi:unnamed protein product [Symbiodinium sp. CCMP2592]|nr:unnamed protein product [Symbiodinium sp. CCMP2592]